MKISYIHGVGNKGNTFVAQGILKSSLPYQANLNATPQYLLTPDYFLPSSQSESYYSRKHSGRTNYHNLNHYFKHSKLLKVVSIGLLATSIEVQALSTTVDRNLSSALPDVVPTFPLPDLIQSNPPVAPPPPPPLPDIVPPVILPDVVPVPPAPPMAPSMPDLLSDAGSSKSNKKSALLQSIRDFGGKLFKLKKVKQEPKPKVVLSDGGDLLNQLHNTLERRRKAISGEEGNKKFKKAAKQVIVLNAEEEKARQAEIARKIAENKEKAGTLRKQKEKEWAIKAKQIEAEVEIEKQRKAAEAAKAIRDQKAKERGNDSSTVIAGIDPVLHNCHC